MYTLLEVRLLNRMQNAGLDETECSRFTKAVMGMSRQDAERLLQMFETSPASLVGDFWETVSRKVDALNGAPAAYDALAEKNISRLAASLAESQH